MDQNLAKDIETVLMSILAQEEIDLVNLKVMQQGKNVVIDILVDKPTGGISLQECGKINKQLNHKLAEGNVILQDYYLMVSSPGIDWPLKTRKDFLRTMRHEIRFFLSEKLEGRQEYVGILESVTDTEVVILAAGRQIVIPVEKIRKAMQVV